MYISLDVLMRLGQIALIIAGVIALIYLVLLFKSLMDTFKTLQKTLDALTVDLVKLETPLQTVGQLSETVEEVSGSAKKAAMSAINVFSQSTDKVSGIFSRKKSSPQEKTASSSLDETPAAVKADFRRVTEESSMNVSAEDHEAAAAQPQIISETLTMTETREAEGGNEND